MCRALGLKPLRSIRKGKTVKWFSYRGLHVDQLFGMFAIAQRVRNQLTFQDLWMPALPVPDGDLHFSI